MTADRRQMTKFVTHVALYCRDLDKSAAWYRRVFEMKVLAEAPGRFAALSFGERHHDFALVQAPPEFRDPAPPRIGLYHIAVDTGSFAESLAIFKRARAENAEFVKAIDHRVGNGIYIRDPDGNILELWSEIYATMAEAIASIAKMDPPFQENPIGFPLDIEETVRTGKPVHLVGAKPPSPITHS